MVKIIFEPEFPEMFREPVREMLEPMLVLCPLWLQFIYLHWDADDEDNHATMDVRRDYRRASMTLTRSFFESSRFSQLDTLVHEITHVYTTPLYTLCRELLNLLCPNGEESTDQAAKQLYTTLHEKARHLTEQCNQDLTYTHMKIAGWLPDEEEAPRSNPLTFRGHIREKALTSEPH